MAGQIAVVGPKDAVLAFRALGVTVAPAQEPEAVSHSGRFRRKWVWHAGGARQCGKGRRRGHFVGKKGGRVNQCGRESLRRSPAR